HYPQTSRPMGATLMHAVSNAFRRLADLPHSGTLRIFVLAAFLAAMASLPGVQSAAAAEAKPAFQSKVITAETPAHAVEINVPLNGARQLYLVASDGGNGYACDWADWCEPRLVGKQGQLKLTELKWKSATTGWGQVRVNQNCEGGPLRVGGRTFDFGIGTHA